MQGDTINGRDYSRGFVVGMSGELDGVQWEVRQGRKGPADKMLWISVEKRPIGMSLGFLLADFFFENENILYPPPAQGGKMYLDYCRKAANHGYWVPVNELRLSRNKGLTLETPPAGLVVPRNAIFAGLDD